MIYDVLWGSENGDAGAKKKVRDFQWWEGKVGRECVPKSRHCLRRNESLLLRQIISFVLLKSGDYGEGTICHGCCVSKLVWSDFSAGEEKSVSSKFVCVRSNLRTYIRPANQIRQLKIMQMMR